MYKWVRKWGNWFLDHFPGKQYIVFESEPDLSDNTKAVFDEMLRRGIQNRYRFVWWVKDQKADWPAYPNTIYADQRTRWHSLCFSWYQLRAKCLICCNKFLTIPRSSVKSFYLTHGTTVKSLPGYSIPEGITCTLVGGEGVKDFMARELKVDISTLHALGYPRNDVLHTANKNLHTCLEGDFDKVIVWYPTYRQHRNGLKTDAVNALPILHDAKKAEALNQIARDNRVLIVLKPHFAQDVSYIKDQKLSNICFIDDQFFAKHKLSSYEFVGSCDAMITDYSSIYYDFLLCDKPVAVVWEDIAEYRKNPGIAVDIDYYMKGAHKIYDIDDFAEFIRDVSAGQDLYAAQRAEINALVNCAGDGKNSERVVDFIIEQAAL